MARLELKFDNIRRYGFPYACMLCTTDENMSMKRTKFAPKGERQGYGCALFLGPFGWLIGLIYFLVSSFRGKPEFDVPVCEKCQKAKKAVNVRTGVMSLIAISSLIAPFWVTEHEWVAPYCVVVFLFTVCAFGFDQAWWGSQFDLQVLKLERDRVLVDVPDEDYPNIYQRHLDTAALYGTVETLGAEEDEA